MPYPNEHAVRILQPGQFESKSFRRKSIADGIDIIIGKLKGQDKTTTQAYRFNKNIFTLDQVKAWLKDHKIKPISIEPAANKSENKIQSFVILQGYQYKQFTEDEILAMIPGDILAKIKLTDSHPFFQAYSICHPGISNPKIINGDSEPITWTNKAIQSIKNIVLKGIKLFKGHNADNSTDNREDVGEVVHDFQQEINGELNHMVITYHPPEKREIAKQYDICSQEAKWDLIKTAGGYLADKLKRITGIALGRSDKETPAFAGARRMGMVQAFETKQPEREFKMAGDAENISIEQIKRTIRERNIWPWQLFDAQDVKDDKHFGKIYVEIETLKKQYADEIATLKNQIADKDSLIQQKEQVVNDYAKKETELKKQTYRQSAKPRFEKFMQLKNVTEAQKAFVDLNFNPDNLEIEDLTDEALEKQLDKILAERQKLAAAGILKEDTEQHQGNKEGEKKTTSESSDYTDPANNELL